MTAFVPETVVDLLSVAFYALVASVLTLLGTFVELSSLRDLTAGQTVLGLWEVGVGVLLVYAGINVLTDFVVPGLREFRSGSGTESEA
jgi:hypothetical protein